MWCSPFTGYSLPAQYWTLSPHSHAAMNILSLRTCRRFLWGIELGQKLLESFDKLVPAYSVTKLLTSTNTTPQGLASAPLTFSTIQLSDFPGLILSSDRALLIYLNFWHNQWFWVSFHMHASLLSSSSFSSILLPIPVFCLVSYWGRSLLFSSILDINPFSVLDMQIPSSILSPTY